MQPAGQCPLNAFESPSVKELKVPRGLPPFCENPPIAIKPRSHPTCKPLKSHDDETNQSIVCASAPQIQRG
jgi:hypothetical protein